MPEHMITTILPAKMNLEATSKDNSTVFTRAASFVSRLVLSSSTLNCPTIANNTLACETRTGRETHLVPSFLFYFWFYTHTHFMYQPVGQLSIGVMEVLVHYVGFRLFPPHVTILSLTAMGALGRKSKTLAHHAEYQRYEARIV